MAVEFRVTWRCDFCGKVDGYVRETFPQAILPNESLPDGWSEVIACGKRSVVCDRHEVVVHQVVDDLGVAAVVGGR